MFQFPGFASKPLCVQGNDTWFCPLMITCVTTTNNQVGCPIRRSMDQSLFPAPHGLTQGITSFIASCCQGIHQTPLSRLIRSRRRQALLCAVVQNRNPSSFIWSEVIDPCASSRQGIRWLRSSNDLAVRRVSRSVSLDLERLFLVAPSAPDTAGRLAPSCHARHGTMSAPHLERTQKRLVYCSLYDVS